MIKRLLRSNSRQHAFVFRPWSKSRTAAVVGLAMLWAGLGLSDHALAARGQSNGSPAREGAHSLLSLLDGSRLHGNLGKLTPAEGLVWHHPAASAPIRFESAQIDRIRFAHARARVDLPKSQCLFRFHNGDALFGDLISLDGNEVRLKTWLGDELTALRRAIESITFFPGGYSVLYAGPTGLEGWDLGQNPRGWRYENGAFVTRGGGTLGRKFDLQGSCSLEFDLDWNGRFGMMIVLYTPVVKKLDYSKSGYRFYLRPGGVTLQRIKTGERTVNMGQAEFPEILHNDKLHVAIRADKADETISMSVEGKRIESWHDNEGFVTDGSGILFSAQRSGPVVRLSNMKVATWEGNFNPLSLTNRVEGKDLVALVNHDRVEGELESLQGDEFEVKTPYLDVGVPVSRVSQIYFDAANPIRSSKRGEVRAEFWGGGSISFRLEQWRENRIAGASKELGSLSFDPASVRELKFNLDAERSPVSSLLIDQGPPLRGDENMQEIFPDADD